MKQSDIFSILLIATVGMLAAYFLLNTLMDNPDDATMSFKTISAVSANLAQPDPEVFNSDAINPTVEVYVGECVDLDGDGALSQTELVACGRLQEKDVASGEEKETRVDVYTRKQKGSKCSENEYEWEAEDGRTICVPEGESPSGGFLENGGNSGENSGENTGENSGENTPETPGPLEAQ